MNNWLIALKTGCTIISIIPFSLKLFASSFGTFSFTVSEESIAFLLLISSTLEARIKERKDEIKIMKS